VRRRRRDRRGPRSPRRPRGLPISRTAAQTFDELVLEAIEHLAPTWGEALSQVQFAVEDVPDVGQAVAGEEVYDPDVVEDAQIPLGRVVDAASNPSGRPLIVIYRRPLESRALDEEDLADLVLEVVVDRFAHVLGKDPDEIDPID
jgi:predicted Zn-dependent protease with MMP-like domain